MCQQVLPCAFRTSSKHKWGSFPARAYPQTLQLLIHAQKDIYLAIPKKKNSIGS